jgi:hypothetical protein
LLLPRGATRQAFAKNKIIAFNKAYPNPKIMEKRFYTLSGGFVPFYSYGEWRAFLVEWSDDDAPEAHSLTQIGLSVKTSPRQANTVWQTAALWYQHSTQA